MQKNTSKLSVLEEFYFTALPDEREYFYECWIKYFQKSIPNFYYSLKNPKIEDLALFSYCCNKLILEDKIIRHYDFKSKGIEPISENPLFV